MGYVLCVWPNVSPFRPAGKRSSPVWDALIASPNVSDSYVVSLSMFFPTTRRPRMPNQWHLRGLPKCGSCLSSVSRILLIWIRGAGRTCFDFFARTLICLSSFQVWPMTVSTKATCSRHHQLHHILQSRRILFELFSCEFSSAWLADTLFCSRCSHGCQNDYRNLSHWEPELISKSESLSRIWPSQTFTWAKKNGYGTRRATDAAIP